MNESADWQFDIEDRPPDWKFPAGKTWLAGWIWSPISRLADLRVWIDGRPFLALHGLPKPGLDERFLGRPSPPYLGFVSQVEPHRGATLLRLEVRGLSAGWREIFRTTITVSPTAALKSPPRTAAELLEQLVPGLLRLQQQRPALITGELADQILSSAISTPLNSLPNPPFHGALETPRETGWVRFGRLSVSGWLAHRQQPIKRLFAMIDPQQEVPLIHGLQRMDIDAIFADLPGRANSGFAGQIDTPVIVDPPVLLKIFAELTNGEKHLVFAQRFCPQIIPGTTLPLPPLSRLTFARVVWTLFRSAQRQGLPYGSLWDWRRAIKAAWQSYSAEAPFSSPPHPIVRPRGPVPASPEKPLGLLVVTHNLNLEGAPWFILELATHLARQPGWRVRVISPLDGPLRQKFADAGLPVQIVDTRALLGTTTIPDFESSLEKLASELNWTDADLVVANTMVSFWAVPLARLRNRPALLYIHESSPVRQFFAPTLAPALFPVVESAFAHARRVVFVAAASQAIYGRLEHQGNFRCLPSWINVPGILRFSADNTSATLRQRHHFSSEAVIFANIGSVCERKGQHVFVRAIALLLKRLQTAGRTVPPLHFLMVGARPGPYLEELRADIGLLGLTGVRIINEVPGPYDFYRLSDIFVCSSFEEAFPRVLLEAATFSLPIVSTNVNGIIEMLTPDDAWLVPPGDATALAEAMEQALLSHLAGDRTRAQRAHTHVTSRFSADCSLPLHRAMALEAAAP